MNFGLYLRKLREDRNLRQADLAEKIGVSPVYISDIERGRRNPPDSEKLRIWVDQLSLSQDEASIFYDLVGNARGNAPPDIMEYLNSNQAAISAIRRIMGQKKEFNWDTIAHRR